MAEMRHNGGIVSTYLELGFDQVKYFEVELTTTPYTLTDMVPPPRRLQLRNASETENVYLNITGDAAQPIVGPSPGDNIKVGPQGIFIMDFDVLRSISMVTGSGVATVEGILGFKGTAATPGHPYM
jgi:hypothetical protein